MLAELAIAATLASHYAHKPVTAECFQFGRNDPTLADTVPGGTEMRLSTRVCGALRRPAHTPAFAEAILTVIHEAKHLQGDTNEDRVECWAARRTPAALYRFYGVANTKALVRSVTFRPECVR